MDRKTYPRVTGVLGVMQDFSRIPRHVLERKRQLGTALHKCIELHMQGVLDESSIDEQVQPYFNAYLRLREECPIDFIRGEERLYSDKYLYCGAPDLLCVMNGKRTVVDFKTLYAPDDLTHLQTAAYQNLFEEAGEQVRTRVVIYLKKDERYRMFFSPNSHKVDFNVFLGLLNYHNWVQGMKA